MRFPTTEATGRLAAPPWADHPTPVTPVSEGESCRSNTPWRPERRWIAFVRRRTHACSGATVNDPQRIDTRTKKIPSMKLASIKLLPWLLGSIALTAQAVSITGQIGIQSSSVGMVPNASGVLVTSGSGSANGLVTSVNGDFPETLLYDLATYQPFNLSLGAQAITSLWSVTDVVPGNETGFSYSFDLGSITSIIQADSKLIVSGAGILKSTNPALDATAALWTFGLGMAEGSPSPAFFAFHHSEVAVIAVPDRESSLLLLALALVGFLGLARTFERFA
jgi:hypothetical protein